MHMFYIIHIMTYVNLHITHKHITDYDQLTCTNIKYHHSEVKTKKTNITVYVLFKLS